MFKRMYLRLFNRITDAIEALEHGDAVQAKTILIRAQQDAEQQYIKPKEIIVLSDQQKHRRFL